MRISSAPGSASAATCQCRSPTTRWLASTPIQAAHRREIPLPARTSKAARTTGRSVSSRTGPPSTRNTATGGTENAATFLSTCKSIWRMAGLPMPRYSSPASPASLAPSDVPAPTTTSCSRRLPHRTLHRGRLFPANRRTSRVSVRWRDTTSRISWIATNGRTTPSKSTTPPQKTIRSPIPTSRTSRSPIHTTRCTLRSPRPVHRTSHPRPPNPTETPPAISSSRATTPFTRGWATKDPARRTISPAIWTMSGVRSSCRNSGHLPCRIRRLSVFSWAAVLPETHRRNSRISPNTIRLFRPFRVPSFSAADGERAIIRSGNTRQTARRITRSSTPLPNRSITAGNACPTNPRPSRSTTR